MTLTPKINTCPSPVDLIRQAKDVDNNVFTISGKTADYEANTSKDLKAMEADPLQRIQYPTTYLQTLAHMLKGNIATGVFAMGDAFKNAGMLFAPFMLVFLGVIAVFNQHILINSAKLVKKNSNLEYYPHFDDTVFYCFENGPTFFKRLAKYSRTTVNLCLIVASLGFCSVYFVFVSTSIKQVLDHHGITFDVHIHMMFVLIIILLFCFIRNLKFLAPVSMIATILIFFAIGVTIYFSLFDLPPISSRKAVANLYQLPLFFGTAVYCFEGISLVLPLQREMKNPEKFNSPFGVLNFGMIIVTAVLLSTGIIGYWKYGENVAGSLTLNLPTNNPLSQYVNIAVAIGVLLTYPLLLYVPVVLVWPMLISRWGPFKRPLLCQYLMRFGLVLITFVFAEVVPNVGLFISLVGSITSTTIAFLIPPLLDLSVRWGNDFGFLRWRLIVDIFTFLIGCYGVTSGAYTSINSIVTSWTG